MEAPTSPAPGAGAQAGFLGLNGFATRHMPRDAWPKALEVVEVGGLGGGLGMGGTFGFVGFCSFGFYKCLKQTFWSVFLSVFFYFSLVLEVFHD